MAALAHLVHDLPGDVMELQVKIDDQTRTVAVERSGDGWVVTLDDGEPIRVTGAELASGEWALRIDGRRQVAGVNVDGARVDLQVGGRDWRAEVVDARKAALQLGAGGGEGAVSTQMPGVIVRTLVAEGDAVSEGDPVIVVEAMKMENEFKAPVSGTVERIAVQDGQAVEAGTTLVVIAPAE